MTSAPAIAVTMALLLTVACATELEREDEPDLGELAAGSGDLPGNWQVCGWEHAAFEGERTCWGGLPPGSYRMPTLIGHRVGNDMMSSVAVRPGVAVGFFEHIHFEGTEVVMIAQPGTPEQWYPDMSAHPVGNDGASSMIMYVAEGVGGAGSDRTELAALGDAPDGWQACAWEHADYQGARTCWSGLPPGEYWLPMLVGYDVGNDMMSSVAINGHQGIVLFEDVNFAGRSNQWVGLEGPPWGVADLSLSWVGNDSASSLALMIF